MYKSCRAVLLTKIVNKLKCGVKFLTWPRPRLNSKPYVKDGAKLTYRGRAVLGLLQVQRLGGATNSKHSIHGYLEFTLDRVQI